MSKGARGKKPKKPEPQLILIPNSSNDIYAGIDANYFPDEASGDIVKWSNDGTYKRISAKCKGCLQVFETETNEQLQMYLLHCIQMCDEYKNLDLIRHCYPCNKYCINVQAFLQHSQDVECPAHEYLTLKKRNDLK